MARGKSEKTKLVEETLASILAGLHPQTVRQAFYQLVSRQVVENTKSRYNAVSNILVAARQSGAIPWEWVEDRTRRPRRVSMWGSMDEFARTVVRAYRKNVWQSQPRLVEVWLEKDALSGIFEDELAPYGVTLNVGRGYDGWSSIHEAALRYQRWGNAVVVLYFGDHDPSGEDMERSLRDRLAYFKASPEMRRVAILPEDIREYNLPPDFAKATDTRRKGFVAKYGDQAVELDALPVDVLRERIVESVVAVMDLDALEAVQEQDNQTRIAIRKAMDSLR